MLPLNDMARGDLPKYVSEKPVTVRRNGRVYKYVYLEFRKDGFRKKLPPIDSPRFPIEYQKCLTTPHYDGPLEYSLAWLIQQYKELSGYADLAKTTKQNRDRYFDIIEETRGDTSLVEWNRINILRLRKKHEATPGKADNLIATLSVLFDFAIDIGLRETNPCHGVSRISKGEHQPWPQHVMDAALEAASPMLRLAIQAHYYTGQRIGDVCKMQWGHIHDGDLHVHQEKTGKTVIIPLHRDFLSALAQVPRESVFLLYGERKQPFIPDTLRERLRVLMRAIGYGYKFHGLRKNAVNALLEATCTPHEVSAITGQSLDMIAHYSKAVDNKKLARSAVAKWEKG